MVQRGIPRIRRRLSEIIDFIRQCLLELSGKDKKRQRTNSDLRGHSFVSMPNQIRNRKSTSFMRVKLIRRKQQRNRIAGYSTSTHQPSIRFKIMTLSVVLFGMLCMILASSEVVGRLLGSIALFQVQDLRFTGCESSSEERLRQLTDITLYKTSLLNLDKEGIERAIEADPWVSKVTVKRDWPSALIIEVVEHQPVALVNTVEEGGPRLFYIDKKGKPFLEVKQGFDIDFPVLTGRTDFIDNGDDAGIFSDIYTFLKLVGNNNPNLPAQSVSEIHVNEQGEIVVYLVDHTFPIFFGRGQIADKYRRLVRVLSVLYKEKKKGFLLSGVEYIRMDYLNDKVLIAQSESG